MAGFVASVKRLLSPIKRALKPVYFRLLDMTDAAERRREMLPPRTMRFIGDGDFKGVGLKFCDLFTQYGGLKPDDRVLDVGSGIGRMAVPLTSYLSAKGVYHGFDIVKMGVVWCQENITPKHPNFHFLHTDIHNKDYNAQGAIQASNFRFPYESDYFDFVFLTSVFTHMFPADMENYLKEIARVMKPGSTCFITYFLLNAESVELVKKGLSMKNFIYSLDGCMTTTPESPEAAIAFPEPYVCKLFGKYGLSMTGPVRFGSWCGRARFLSYQDIVVARKD
jgi:SAM-dependent methyltransferase